MAVSYVFAFITIGLVGLATVPSQSSASSGVEPVINQSTSFAATFSAPRAFASSSPTTRKTSSFYQSASPEPIPTSTNGVIGLVRIAAAYGREAMCGAVMILDPLGIITVNYHIVSHSSPTFPVYIPEKGSTHPARLIGYSPLTDVAIPRVGGLPPLTPITSVAKFPVPGDPAIMSGFPDSEGWATAALGYVQTGVARNRGTMTIDNFMYDGMSFLMSCHAVSEYSSRPTVNPRTGQIPGMNTRYYIDSKV